MNETITATAQFFVADTTSVHFFKEQFSVDGSVSGHIGTAWADFAFTSSQINFTVATGSIPFSAGDRFSIPVAHSHLAPSYPRLCYAVMNQMYVGTTSYPKPFEFIVRRCPDPFGQGPSVAIINGSDGNGILGIYELMTDIYFGLGITAEKFNVQSFKDAAATVASEGLGISFQQDSFDSADSIIGEILRHLDGVIYTDPSTGLWTVKLARADYDPTTIPVLDVSSIKSVDYARGSWEETRNHLIVSYLSRDSNFNVRTVQAYDPANIAVTREVRSESSDFKFIGDRGTASLVTMRVLKTLSAPLGKLKIVTDRKAWNFRMAGVFKLNWTPLGIEGMIFRIAHIGYGQVSAGDITIDAVEDIFGITNVAFVSAPESGWVNPVGAPVAPVQQKLFEVPYHLLIDGGMALGRYALAMATRGDATSRSFQIWNTDATVYESVPDASFIPSARLAANYAASTAALDGTGFTIVGLIDGADLASGTADDLASGKHLVLIDDEIMAWETITDPGTGIVSISNVLRGVLDTVPAFHSLGAVVWFFSEGAVTTKSVPVLSDISVESQFLPENDLGVYPISSATGLSLLFNSRYERPYPPGNVRVNGGAYGFRPTTVPADLTVTWNSRNRLTQTAAGMMVAQDSGDYDVGEVGQFYTVVKIIGGVIVGTVTAGESFIYTQAQRAIDDPDFTKITTLEIYSNVGALTSYFPQVISLKMTAPITGLPSPGRYEFGATTVGGELI